MEGSERSAFLPSLEVSIPCLSSKAEGAFFVLEGLWIYKYLICDLLNSQGPVDV